MESVWGLLTEVESGKGADDELVRAALANPAVFDQLYCRHAARVFWYLHSRTGSPDEAADLTQVVFLRAFETLLSYRRHDSFLAWLLRIARNAAIDAHRRRRWLTVPWRETTDSPRQESPESLVLQSEEAERVHRLVARLAPRKRELLALRFGAGLTVREIAEVVGRSEPAVKKELQRIMSRLKEQYGDD